MAKFVVALALFVACAFAQYNFVEIVPGATPQTGTLLPVLSSTAAEWPQVYYRLWVPENVESLTMTFAQTDSVCTGDIRYYIHADHVPCGSKWSEGTDTNFPCRESISDYFTDTFSETETLYPGSGTNTALITPGNYVYISLNRDSTSDFASTCTYTITTTLTTCAGANEFAVNEGSSTATCKAHSQITLPYTANWFTSAGLTEAYFRVWVPERTAHLTVYVNNTEYSTYFYGNPKYPGGSYYYECYDSASYNAANVYEIQEVCYNPPVGWFYLYFYTSSSSDFLAGNVSIVATSCMENQAGYNCTYQAWNLTGSAALNNAQWGIEASEGASVSFPDAFKVWYISSVNGTLATYNFTVTLTLGTSAYLYYRRGGYIADDVDNYLFYEGLSLNTAERIALTAGDFWVGGSHFFGVSNEGSATINFTLSSAAASVSTTGVTGVSTTGDATTDGSGAAGVVASFLLIAASIAALF